MSIQICNIGLQDGRNGLKPSAVLLASAMPVAAVVLLMALCQAPQVSAQAVAKDNNPVQIQLQRKKVSVADGKETLAVADTAKPGELVEETATYGNKSKRTFRVDATLPVPQFTEFVADSTRPASAKASVDGKIFSDMPLKRQIKQPNGVTVEQLIPLSEYKFLRWKGVELGPEKSFAVSARFRIKDGISATSPAGPTANILK